MMPDRIGIIGNTQGVSDNSRPKPKKLRSTKARLSPLNRPAMRELSSPAAGAAAEAGEVMSPRACVGDGIRSDGAGDTAADGLAAPAMVSWASWLIGG